MSNPETDLKAAAIVVGDLVTVRSDEIRKGRVYEVVRLRPSRVTASGTRAHLRVVRGRPTKDLVCCCLGQLVPAEVEP